MKIKNKLPIEEAIGNNKNLNKSIKSIDMEVDISLQQKQLSS